MRCKTGMCGILAVAVLAGCGAPPTPQRLEQARDGAGQPRRHPPAIPLTNPPADTGLPPLRCVPDGSHTTCSRD